MAFLNSLDRLTGHLPPVRVVSRVQTTLAARAPREEHREGLLHKTSPISVRRPHLAASQQRHLEPDASESHPTSRRPTTTTSLTHPAVQSIQLLGDLVRRNQDARAKQTKRPSPASPARIVKNAGAGSPTQTSSAPTASWLLRPSRPIALPCYSLVTTLPLTLPPPSAATPSLDSSAGPNTALELFAVPPPGSSSPHGGAVLVVTRGAGRARSAVRAPGLRRGEPIPSLASTCRFCSSGAGALVGVRCFCWAFICSTRPWRSGCDCAACAVVRPRWWWIRLGWV